MSPRGSRPVSPLRRGRRAKPTLRHRPAVWAAMLGTVYAANPDGVVRYFDYDWDAAMEWAAIGPDDDPRVWRHEGRSGTGAAQPRKGQWVLYARRAR